MIWYTDYNSVSALVCVLGRRRRRPSLTSKAAEDAPEAERSVRRLQVDDER